MVLLRQHYQSQILNMLRRILPRSGALKASPSRLLQGAVYQNVRQYSIKLDAAATTTQLDIDPSRLVIQHTKHPKPLQKPEDLVFGATFTGTPASFSRKNKTLTGRRWLTDRSQHQTTCSP